MKRLFICLLAVIMTLYLTACGGNTEPVQGADVSAPQVEAQSVESEPTDSMGQEVEKVVEEETLSVPSFDNSWASNEYEKQIPQLPFANWSVAESHEESTYLIKIKDVLYTDAKAYGETLKACGFEFDLWVDDETGGGNYRLMAENKNGYAVDFDFNAYSFDTPITGLATLEIEKTRETEVQIPERTKAETWTLDTVPKPTMDGQAGENIGEDYVEYISRNASYQSLMDYESLLTTEDFTIEVTEKSANRYTAVATNGNARIDITFETADWDLTDPEALANGAAGLDTSIFDVYITVEETENLP